ncbi:MAG: hypothetical protein H0V34_08015, partial [Gammaproteobacteria bacterium]|nr:hypothetical protein [Gammaproteobacteria bacterium]
MFDRTGDLVCAKLAAYRTCYFRGPVDDRRRERFGLGDAARRVFGKHVAARRPHDALALP